MNVDYDPYKPAGRGAIRYALSTSPVLVAMPIGLCIPSGAWFGSVESGIKVGFYACVLLPAAAEFIRRGTLHLESAAIRRVLLQFLTAVFIATPALSVLGAVLSFIAVDRCSGAACSTNDAVFNVVGLVFASFAVLGSVALVSLLRSPVWARHRAASAAGPG